MRAATSDDAQSRSASSLSSAGGTSGTVSNGGGGGGGRRRYGEPVEVEVEGLAGPGGARRGGGIAALAPRRGVDGACMVRHEVSMRSYYVTLPSE